MPTLEQRLDIIEARTAISELRSAYCWYTTRGNREEVVKLFTVDGVFQNARNSQASPHGVKGTDALLAYFERVRPGRRVPMVTNEVTRIDGDSAQGTCVMQALGEENFCGHYVDDFRKVDGRWLFQTRRYYPYWPSYKPSEERIAP